jgi:hypothetical protein
MASANQHDANKILETNFQSFGLLLVRQSLLPQENRIQKQLNTFHRHQAKVYLHLQFHVHSIQTTYYLRSEVLLLLKNERYSVLAPITDIEMLSNPECMSFPGIHRYPIPKNRLEIERESDDSPTNNCRASNPTCHTRVFRASIQTFVLTFLDSVYYHHGMTQTGHHHTRSTESYDPSENHPSSALVAIANVFYRSSRHVPFLIFTFDLEIFIAESFLTKSTAIHNPPDEPSHIIRCMSGIHCRTSSMRVAPQEPHFIRRYFRLYE